MIGRLAVASARSGSRIDALHIEPHVRGFGLQGRLPARGEGRLTSLRAERLAAERDTLKRLLQQYDGVVAEVARALGISRQSFYKAMRRTGLIRGNRSLIH